MVAIPRTTLTLTAGLGGFGLLSYGVGLAIGGSPCPVKQLSGLSCPGCGATTAGLDLLQGNLAAAWAANGLFTVAYFLLPLALGFLLVSELRGAAVGRWLTDARFLSAIGAVLLAWGALRLAL